MLRYLHDGPGRALWRAREPASEAVSDLDQNATPKPVNGWLGRLFQPTARPITPLQAPVLALNQNERPQKATDVGGLLRIPRGQQRTLCSMIADIILVAINDHVEICGEQRRDRTSRFAATPTA